MELKNFYGNRRNCYLKPKYFLGGIAEENQPVGRATDGFQAIAEIPPISGCTWVEMADNEHDSLLMTIGSQGNCGTFEPTLKPFPRIATAFLGLG
jgi:hypothetical protein